MIRPSRLQCAAKRLSFVVISSMLQVSCPCKKRDENMPKKALIMVDLQNDFCQGGSLAVPGADEIISLANQLQPRFDLVIATKDWHPQDHTSFASNHPGHSVGDLIMINGISQILWQDHCVQKTYGAAFHPQLNTQLIKKIFYKGTDKNIDSYSAFFDNAHRRATGLSDYLKEAQVEDVYIMGLATDYCVKYSSLDAVQQGFNVFVMIGACRGVDLHPGDSTTAIYDMQTAGAHILQTNDYNQFNISMCS